MEENETIHSDYQKGFNEGYLMKKYLPDMADKLGQGLDKSERGVGFQDGKNQYALEQRKERYPAWLKSDRLSNLDKDQDKNKEKDRGDLELER